MRYFFRLCVALCALAAFSTQAIAGVGASDRDGPISSYPTPSWQPLVPNGPSIADLLNAHAVAYVSYMGGQYTAQPGEVAFPSPFGGFAYYHQRLIEGARCQALGKGAYKCTYSLTSRTVPDRDSLFGKLSTAGARQPQTDNRILTFTKRGNLWWSSELDKETQVFAAKWAAQRASGQAANDRNERDAADAERRRKDLESRQDAAKAWRCVGNPNGFGC